MKKKCFIFDLDGTLINSLSTISHFGNLALKAVGLSPIDEEKYKILVGDGKKILVHRMLDYYNADTEDMFQKTEKVYDSHYEADTLYKTTAYNGIFEMLNELKKRSITIAVCSNKPDNVVVDVVKTIFGDIFDIVRGLKDNENKKPAPDITLDIINELGFCADECVFAGDTNVDIFTAKNANMTSVGVLWGFRDFDELNEAGADYIIEHPSQIIEIIDKLNK